MNVTPLIDVLLVLLVIFMVVTPSRSVGLATDIPQPSPASFDPPAAPVVVSIASDLTIRINSEPVVLSELRRRLLEIFRNRAGSAVFVRAAPDIEFQHVATAIDAAKGAGIARIGLMSALQTGPDTLIAK